jgi:hypothetical protein
MTASAIQTKKLFSDVFSHHKEVYRRVRVSCLIIIFWIFLISILQGAVFGNFTYTVSGSSVTVTDFPTTISGSVDIPSQIEGKTVTTIGNNAFQGCIMTSVTIPSGVTSIGSHGFSYNSKLLEVIILSNSVTLGSSAFSSCWSLQNFTMSAISGYINSYAFGDCRSLQTVIIPPAVTIIGEAAFIGCWGIKNLTLGSGVRTIGKDAFSECWQIPEISFPATLTTIDDRAFADCSNIRKVIIPASLTMLATHAFQFCTSLSEVVFEGNAPLIGANVFYGTKSNITLYYYNGSTGFSSPIWYGLPAVNLGEKDIVDWLASYGYAYDTNLLSDPNNDGVPLLMAYALNLDPKSNLSSAMPKATLSEGVLSMTFYGGRQGITYVVETSNNLRDWTSIGVSISAPNAANHRTATTQATGTSRFLRLTVSK